jgi:hypothetical protein
MSSYSSINKNQNIPLYSLTSNDWANPGAEPSYAVNLDVGINEYTFSRTTPNNDFIVSTGLVNTPTGIEMVGSGKSKKIKPIKKKETKPKLVKKETKPKLVKKETKPKLVKKETKPKLVKKETKPKLVKKETKPIKKESNKKNTLINKIKKFFKNSKDKLKKVVKK